MTTAAAAAGATVQDFRRRPRTSSKEASSSSFLTRTKTFERLAEWAFSVCDIDQTGKINKTELYTGILLVHLNLAKYAGPAACYPPSREVVEGLFDVIDEDDSKTIDKTEFLQILKICSVDIASRIAVYYSILILLVPYIADAIVRSIFHVDARMGWNATKVQVRFFSWIETTLLSWHELAERIVSMALFFFVIPTLFNMVDSRSKRHARIVTTNDVNEDDDDDDKANTAEDKKEE